MARAAPCCLAALLTACGPPCGDEPPSLTIGTGESSFEPLGDSLAVVAGPQGGWHVFGSLRATGLWSGGDDALFDGTAPTVTFRAAAEDHEAGFEDTPRAFAQAGSALELAGALLVWDLTEPSGLQGLAVTLDAEVVDACGARATATADSTLDVP